MFPRSFTPRAACSVAALILAVALLAPSAANAIPDKIAINGGIEAPEGGRIYAGDYPIRLTFYDGEEEAANLLTALESTVTITTHGGVSGTDGMFAAFFDVPTELLTLDEIWYDVAIDMDRDGFDDDDLFEQRIYLASVFFTQSTLPSEYFQTGAGAVQYSGGANPNTHPQGSIVFIPFSTPPGGVRFNRIASVNRIAGGYTYNYPRDIGIYDIDGNLIVNLKGAPVLSGSLPHGNPTIYEAEGFLDPADVYFLAYTWDTTQVYGVWRTNATDMPGYGVILGGASNLTLPATIDWEQLQPTNNPQIGIGLYWVEESTSKKGTTSFKASRALQMGFTEDEWRRAVERGAILLQTDNPD